MHHVAGAVEPHRIICQCRRFGGNPAERRPKLITATLRWAQLLVHSECEFDALRLESVREAAEDILAKLGRDRDAWRLIRITRGAAERMDFEVFSVVGVVARSLNNDLLSLAVHIPDYRMSIIWIFDFYKIP